MKIDKYISELLITHDCLVVPGFGAFVSNYKSAEIQDKGSYSHFSPPSKKIVFNPNLKYNDGLLISYLVEKEFLEYKTAKEQIDIFINNVNKEIHSNKRVYFSGLGFFYLNTARKIVFEPTYDENMLADSYGLPEFESNLIRATNYQKLKKNQANEIFKAIISNKLFLRSMIALPIVAGMLFVPPKYYNTIGIATASFFSINKQNTDNKQDIDLNNNSKEFVSTNNEKEIAINRLNDSVIKLKKFIKDEETADITLKKYHIIVASFTENKNAEAFINKTIFSEYTPQIIHENNFRVSIFESSDKQEVINKLHTLKEKFPQFKDAWVLTLK
ncbi:MAG: hypothetical protein SNJ71_02280 [Bacteroidales bacterium]